MKKRGFLISLALAVTALISGCGGGSSDSSGTISMNITDAKPALRTTGVVESVTITFDEVSVHKSGGGWITLPVATQPQPYTMDLYQFSSEGTKTQFVPPVSLASGKYTQVRIGVTSGTIRINGVDHPLEIPSANLKTDKNFEFDVPEGGAVDLTVDFDLSQSIVLTGTGTVTYQLKPVVHLVTTAEAWTIKGNIDSSSFDSDQAFVVVYRDLATVGDFDAFVDEKYTELIVPKGSSASTEFSVYWLVPDENYYVEVYLGDPDSGGSLKYYKFINSTGLDSDTNWDPDSKVYLLEGGANLF